MIKIINRALTYVHKPAFTVYFYKQLLAFQLSMIHVWQFTKDTYNQTVRGEVMMYIADVAWQLLSAHLTRHSTLILPSHTFVTGYKSRFWLGGLIRSDSAELEWQWLWWLPCCVSLVWEPSSLAESVPVSTACAAVVRWADDGTTLNGCL